MQCAGVTTEFGLKETQTLLTTMLLKETKYRYEILCRNHPEIEEMLVEALLNISDFRLNRKRLHKHTNDIVIIFEDKEETLFDAIRKVSLLGTYEDVYFLAYNSKDPEKVRETYQRLLASVFQFNSELEAWKNLIGEYGVDVDYFFPELIDLEAELNEFVTKRLG